MLFDFATSLAVDI